MEILILSSASKLEDDDERFWTCGFQPTRYWIWYRMMYGEIVMMRRL